MSEHKSTSVEIETQTPASPARRNLTSALQMKITPLKFAGLLSAAIVAPAFFAAPAMADDEDAVYSREVSKKPEVQSQVAAMASGKLKRNARGTLDRLLLWNGIMQDSNALDHTPSSGFAGDQQGPTRNSRAFAIVSIAVFDAVNAFDQRFSAYNVIAPAPRGASRDAAIAQAAYTTLRALHPRQVVRLDQLFSSDLSAINASPEAVAAGRAVGLASANAILQRRANDNANHVEPAFGAGGVIARGATVGFAGVGAINGGNLAAPNWTPDPVGLPRGVALGARWGNVTPFVLNSGDQFRVPPTPTPGTPRFRAGFSDVTAIGADPTVAGSTNGAREQFIGNFWGYDGAALLGTPPRLYNQVAISIANAKRLRRVDSYARLLALVNTTMADSGIAAWDSKYFYNYWRPVTGVRRGGEAGDSTIVNIPAWKPFGASVVNAEVVEAFTPPFPAYPSGHATFGAALFESLRDLYPDNTRFTFVSDEYNGAGVDPSGVPRPFVPVRYRSFQEAQEENGQSRIFNGVHWEWDSIEGQNMGVNIARFTIDNAFQRRR